MKPIKPTKSLFASLALILFLSPWTITTLAAQEPVKSSEIKKETEITSLPPAQKILSEKPPVLDQSPAMQEVPLSARIRSAIGLILILGGCYAFSSNRKAISRRVVLWGLGLQWLLAFLVLSDPRAHHCSTGWAAKLNPFWHVAKPVRRLFSAKRRSTRRARSVLSLHFESFQQSFSCRPYSP